MPGCSTAAYLRLTRIGGQPKHHEEADMTTQQEAATEVHDEPAPPEAWDAIAAAYDEFVAPGEQEIAVAALRRAGLTAEQTFLDVAAGPGGLCLAAARMGAATVATDWAPAMVARFLERARSEGLDHVDGRVMDAHSLELEDDRFDVTGSQFGVMLVADQPAALQEMVRVTKPGGEVVLVAYGSPVRFEALQFFIAAVQSVVPDFEGLPDPPPLEFQVADPAVLRDRLVAAGLQDVQVDTDLEERLELRSGEDAWRWIGSSNPIVGMILSEIDEPDQQTVREVLDGMIRERLDEHGVAVLTAPLNIGWGRKPA
jgi:ubiquinone/menaquinone biosynthesis C-methylase UbiE